MCTWQWNSINLHQTHNNEFFKWNHGLWFWICMKIQMHFSMLFHLKMFYKDSICDPCLKNKHGLFFKLQKLEPTNNCWILNHDQSWNLFSKLLISIICAELIFYSLIMYVKKLFSLAFVHLNFVSSLIITTSPLNIDFLWFFSF